MLAIAESRKPDPRKVFKFDWNRVVQHMCTPPASDMPFEQIRSNGSHVVFDNPLELLELGPEKLMELELDPEDIEGIFEPKTCKEVVHEIRQRGIKFTPLLQALDKFEQVALELEVYE